MSRLILILLLLAVPTVCLAQGTIFGTIVAEPNTGNPELGAWTYRLVITWNTGTPHALSHMNLKLDDPDGNCECEEIESALTWGDPIGFSHESPSYCLVYYYGEFLCHGDPSISVDGIMLKFEPYENPECEPGTGGVATFTFYSDYPPVPIAEDNLFLSDKFSGYVGFGPVTGVFPAIPCDPVETERATWGDLKQGYGD
ncbi:MAG: hypothetical protein ABIF77_19840 [bacterium]